MNRAVALLLAALALLLPGAAAHAQQGARVLERVSWVEEWDPATGRWERIADSAPAPRFIPAAATTTTSTTTTMRAGGATITETVIVEAPQRFLAAAHPRMAGTPADAAHFGPFRVLDARRAALVGSTDSDSPAAFNAMLAAHPGLERIEFLDAPGTRNDLANLRLGRLIRAAGLATHVPDGGSARSGAVELFLAGTRRSMEAGALFAVHSWRDEAGREPDDFAPDAPENRLYLDYYAEMGMTEAEARAFYAMTNSVPHADALWLRGAEMARWVAPDAAPQPALALAAPRSRSMPRLSAPFLLAAVPATGALGEVVRASLALALTGADSRTVRRRHAMSPQMFPRIAYADQAPIASALLDSGVAFP